MVNDDRDPYDAFLEDLGKEMDEWLEAGDNLIIGGDMNEDIFGEKVTSLFEERGLVNLIFTKHDPTGFPATYNRNKSGIIIDGIWGTPGLQVICCGYLEANDNFSGDHWMAW